MNTLLKRAALALGAAGGTAAAVWWLTGEPEASPPSPARASAAGETPRAETTDSVKAGPSGEEGSQREVRRHRPPFAEFPAGPAAAPAAPPAPVRAAPAGGTKPLPSPSPSAIGFYFAAPAGAESQEEEREGEPRVDRDGEEEEENGVSAPPGRLIRAQLVNTVETSASGSAPLIGLVTRDLWHRGRLIVPAGAELHGRAAGGRRRDRVMSEGEWLLVGPNGERSAVRGIALDREYSSPGGADSGPSGWGATDGSPGIRGRLTRSAELGEWKLFLATFLSGAAGGLTPRGSSVLYGEEPLAGAGTGAALGAQAVLEQWARQTFEDIRRDGYFVRVPAGREFYLYTQSVLRPPRRGGGGGTLEGNAARAAALRETPSGAPPSAPSAVPGLPPPAFPPPAPAPASTPGY